MNLDDIDFDLRESFQALKATAREVGLPHAREWTLHRVIGGAGRRVWRLVTPLPDGRFQGTVLGAGWLTADQLTAALILDAYREGIEAGTQYGER